MRWLVEQGPPEIQAAIVEQTVRNNWQGLFELKGVGGEGDGRRFGQGKHERRAAISAYIDECARAAVADELGQCAVWPDEGDLLAEVDGSVPVRARA